MKEYRTIDPAVQEMLDHCDSEGVSTQFDRYLAQKPQCKFGQEGTCCRFCHQGPCRIIPNKKGAEVGICGARDYTIVSRNIARTQAGGACAHSDHGREIAYTLLETAEGKAPSYRIKDSEKLHWVAKKVGVSVDGRRDVDIAKDVALKALGDFGSRDSNPCSWLFNSIDEDRQKVFKKNRVNTPAIDRSVVQLMHQTSIGTDADPVSIVFGGLQCALADFTGMSMSTDLSDILFGTPEPVRTTANLGSLKEDCVNIAVNGHNPLLSEMVVEAAKELEHEAKAAGAAKVNMVGICCTGNEVLMRHGVPIAANFGAQEMAIMTGALDALVMDVQCIIPSMQELAQCYHTVLISTTSFASIPGAAHVEFHPETAKESAATIVRMAIERYKRRNPARIRIPNYEHEVIGGFSYEAITGMFQKVNPASEVRFLTDAIKSGQIKGVVQFAGCNNQKTICDQNHLTYAKYLAANDVFIISSGCAAQSFAVEGLLNPEAIEKYAGPGLKKFLGDMSKAAGTPVPLIFHIGSCVDNTRGQRLLTKMAEDMGVTIPQVPYVATAPEFMSEKAVAIGSWFVCMGVPVMVGVVPQLTGSALIVDLVTQAARDVFGGYFMVNPDPDGAAEMILDRLKKRAWRLRVREKAAEEYESKLNNNIYEG